MSTAGRRAGGLLHRGGGTVGSLLGRLSIHPLDEGLGGYYIVAEGQ